MVSRTEVVALPSISFQRTVSHSKILFAKNFFLLLKQIKKFKFFRCGMSLKSHQKPIYFSYSKHSTNRKAERKFPKGGHFSSVSNFQMEKKNQQRVCRMDIDEITLWYIKKTWSHFHICIWFFQKKIMPNKMWCPCEKNQSQKVDVRRRNHGKFMTANKSFEDQ